MCSSIGPSPHGEPPARRPRIRLRLGILLTCLLGATGAVLAACGGDSPLNPSEIRLCLSEGGYRTSASGGSSIPGSVAPDLVMERRGSAVELIVDSTPARARRRAADLRSILATFGVPRPNLRIVSGKNATAVFSGSPPPGQRAFVAACFADPGR